MLITLSLACLFIFLGIAAFFAPAYAYNVLNETVTPPLKNITFFNLATGWNYNNTTLEFERNSQIMGLLIYSFICLVIIGFCIVWFVFVKSKNGLKIKRMIASTAIGFALTLGAIIFISSIEYNFAIEELNLGLFFVFYNLCLIAAFGFFVGECFAISFNIKAKHNRERFDELIAIEESRLPYIKDPYKLELAEANIKYMKQCHKAPLISKEKLKKRREETLKLMLDTPHECHCDGHDHHHEN